MRQSRSRPARLRPMFAGPSRPQGNGRRADASCMGARIGFADVLCSKLADAPPPVAPGRQTAPRIASPSWVHRLEPLRVISAPFVHLRYPHPASAAPAAGGIPVGDARKVMRGGSLARPGRPPREQIAIALL